MPGDNSPDLYTNDIGLVVITNDKGERQRTHKLLPAASMPGLPALPCHPDRPADRPTDC